MLSMTTLLEDHWRKSLLMSCDFDSDAKSQKSKRLIPVLLVNLPMIEFGVDI